MSTPLTQMNVRIRYYQDKVPMGNDIQEGEVPMTTEQQDAYKQLIGDGKAEIVVAKELGESDYGNGGKVFVSIKLTVDQSATGLASGVAWAQQLLDQKVWEAHEYMKQQLISKGILR